MDDIQIDEVDRSILHQLQLNARQTDTEIAEKVDVTTTTVRNRLDKLEDGGVIRGYFVRLFADGHSGIESDGSSLFPFDGEDRVSKRAESALDDIQRM